MRYAEVKIQFECSERIVANDLSFSSSSIGGRLEVAYKSAHIPAKIVMSSGVNLW